MGFDRSNPLRNIKVLWKLFISRIRAKKIIKEFAPQVAVGVGGYASGPILNIAANGYAAFESATMSAGLENSVHAVNVKGVTLANSGKIYAEAPVSFLGAKGADSSSPETSFYLLYTLVDRSGYEMDFDPLQNANLTFTSFDPLLIQSLVPAGSKFIDGVEYGAVQVVPGLQLKKGGSATIRISSNKTGNGTDYELKVAGDQILKEFNILSEAVAVRVFMAFLLR